MLYPNGEYQIAAGDASPERLQELFNAIHHAGNAAAKVSVYEGVDGIRTVTIGEGKTLVIPPKCELDLHGLTGTPVSFGKAVSTDGGSFALNVKGALYIAEGGSLTYAEGDKPIKVSGIIVVPDGEENVLAAAALIGDGLGSVLSHTKAGERENLPVGPKTVKSAGDLADKEFWVGDVTLKANIEAGAPTGLQSVYGDLIVEGSAEVTVADNGTFTVSGAIDADSAKIKVGGGGTLKVGHFALGNAAPTLDGVTVKNSTGAEATAAALFSDVLTSAEGAVISGVLEKTKAKEIKVPAPETAPAAGNPVGGVLTVKSGTLAITNGLVVEGSLVTEGKGEFTLAQTNGKLTTGEEGKYKISADVTFTGEITNGDGTAYGSAALKAAFTKTAVGTAPTLDGTLKFDTGGKIEVDATKGLKVTGDLTTVGEIAAKGAIAVAKSLTTDSGFAFSGSGDVTLAQNAVFKYVKGGEEAPALTVDSGKVDFVGSITNQNEDDKGKGVAATLKAFFDGNKGVINADLVISATDNTLELPVGSASAPTVSGEVTLKKSTALIVHGSLDLQGKLTAAGGLTLQAAPTATFGEDVVLKVVKGGSIDVKGSITTYFPLSDALSFRGKLTTDQETAVDVRAALAGANGTFGASGGVIVGDILIGAGGAASVPAASGEEPVPMLELASGELVVAKALTVAGKLLVTTNNAKVASGGSIVVASGGLVDLGSAGVITLAQDSKAAGFIKLMAAVAGSAADEGGGGKLILGGAGADIVAKGATAIANLTAKSDTSTAAQFLFGDNASANDWTISGGEFGLAAGDSDVVGYKALKSIEASTRKDTDNGDIKITAPASDTDGVLSKASLFATAK